jgi:hypothetical protein
MPVGWCENPTPAACLVAGAPGGLLSESDLVTHPFELLDEASLVRIFLLPLEEVTTAKLVAWCNRLREAQYA